MYRAWFCLRNEFEHASSDPADTFKDVFLRYSGDGVMGPDHLQRLLVEVQGEVDATKKTAMQIIDSQGLECKHLSLDAFFRYLASDDNSPLNPSLGVHHDMNAPLSQYFIYTGHNSYLRGNQLSSESSDIPIIKALNRGVRVIELDLWPNSTKTDIEVRHGRTLTTPVEFVKCLNSIKKHAFVASPYPVIITLEDHLTSDLQAKAAEILKEIFGDSLFYPTSESLQEFPSPEELKFRIMISTKPPKPPKPYFNAEHNDANDASEQMSQRQVTHEYKRMISICSKKRKENMKDSLEFDERRPTRLSLNELLFEKAIVTCGEEVIRFTQKNILRIYPKMTRVNSSNYNPILGWIYGAQMVALNMQGYGRSLWLMHGFFRANGGCGYIKKPDFLTKFDPNDEIFNPMENLPVKKILKVKIYLGYGWHTKLNQTNMGTSLPPILSTKVGIVGVPSDTIANKTKRIQDWTPIWNEEFEFELRVPELALLQIRVHKCNVAEKDGFGGQTCLPIFELRPGIRAVPLFDRKGNEFKPVKLIMHFEFV
ncbi:uncharacterized protein A4U43_C07F4570 [Asparagus officinalis]|uniref:Phosphoinositide phospholipase C n=1 Tax=Asparagus officinalis TaxID=4686 RepID=A0A5P1EEL7_ASPOF|nr:phosphoinositide phospholipase C 2-like [Asparagus officinalis]ONK62500.1 uncharacterized protein A4U43_C07F4570 [Asparagus officinalis]